MSASLSPPPSTLNDGDVTTAKLADLAVTLAKLANEVRFPKIHVHHFGGLVGDGWVDVAGIPQGISLQRAAGLALAEPDNFDVNGVLVALMTSWRDNLLRFSYNPSVFERFSSCIFDVLVHTGASALASGDRARIFNVTDNVAITGSTLTFATTGSILTYQASGNIFANLPSATKTLTLQLRGDDAPTTIYVALARLIFT